MIRLIGHGKGLQRVENILGRRNIQRKGLSRRRALDTFELLTRLLVWLNSW
jgi:hypothetical protein